jgi:arylmalonate decarboxylase
MGRIAPDAGAPVVAEDPRSPHPQPYGWIAKIGLIVPSTNTVNEAEWARMLPPGISVHTSRVLLLGESSRESFDAMTRLVEKAAQELATAEVGLIAYGCTSGSFLRSSDEIRGTITKIAGCPAVTTSDAVVAALRALGARRVALATPYLDFVTHEEVDFLGREGFEVPSWHGLCLGNTQAQRRSINRVPADVTLRLARFVDRPEADAIFLSCTALPTIAVIAALEDELGKPVVTSNQATLWHTLRSLGIGERIAGFGALLERF